MFNTTKQELVDFVSNFSQQKDSQTLAAIMPLLQKINLILDTLEEGLSTDLSDLEKNIHRVQTHLTSLKTILVARGYAEDCLDNNIGPTVSRIYVELGLHFSNQKERRNTANNYFRRAYEAAENNPHFLFEAARAMFALFTHTKDPYYRFHAIRWLCSFGAFPHLHENFTSILHEFSKNLQTLASSHEASVVRALLIKAAILFLWRIKRMDPTFADIDLQLNACAIEFFNAYQMATLTSQSAEIIAGEDAIIIAYEDDNETVVVLNESSDNLNESQLKPLLEKLRLLLFTEVETAQDSTAHMLQTLQATPAGNSSVDKTGKKTISNKLPSLVGNLNDKNGQQQTLEFTIEVMPGDGDCAFHALNITRADFATLLEKNHDNISLRAHLTTEIYELFFGQEMGETTVEWNNRYDMFLMMNTTLQNCSEEIMIAFDEALDPSLNLKDGLIALNQQALTPELEDALNTLETSTDAVQEAGEALKEYCASDDAFEHYLKQVRKDSLTFRVWLGNSAILAYMQATGQNCYIWKKCPGNEGTLRLLSSYDEGNEPAVHLLFGNAHFDRLTALPRESSISPTTAQSNDQAPSMTKQVCREEQSHIHQDMFLISQISELDNERLEYLNNVSRATSPFWTSDLVPLLIPLKIRAEALIETFGENVYCYRFLTPLAQQIAQFSVTDKKEHYRSMLYYAKKTIELADKDATPRDYLLLIEAQNTVKRLVSEENTPAAESSAAQVRPMTLTRGGS